MISRLHGILLQKSSPFLLIDVNGVGYEVEVPLSTEEQLLVLNSEVTLLTHLSIREDAHVLYGFSTEIERKLFRYLIKINGVGPKLALSILSTLKVDDFIYCIHHEDVTRLTKVPGVGKKTAERLIIEMRDRLNELPLPTTTQSRSSSLTQGLTSPVEDAISALIALGYKPQEASRRVYAVQAPGLTSELLIRKALQVQ